QQFLELGEARSETIRDYARRWGVLGICRHGLPASHNPQRATPDNTMSPSDVLNVTAARRRSVRGEAELRRFIDEATIALDAWADSMNVYACTPLGREERDANLPARALAWEPLDKWRLFARQAISILNVADRLKDGTPGRAAD